MRSDDCLGGLSAGVLPAGLIISGYRKGGASRLKYPMKKQQAHKIRTHRVASGSLPVILRFLKEPAANGLQR